MNRASRGTCTGGALRTAFALLVAAAAANECNGIPRCIPIEGPWVSVPPNGEVVFAARTKRMESLGIRLFYQAYRLVHHALTGVVVQVGNFSVVPRAAISARRRSASRASCWNGRR